jgi:hypothetical protein
MLDPLPGIVVVVVRFTGVGAGLRGIHEVPLVRTQFES